jgi:hypothetical protein
VDVLDARVGQGDLLPEEDAPAHGEALFIEPVAQRLELEVAQRQEQGEGRPRQERAEGVIGEQVPVRVQHGGQPRERRRVRGRGCRRSKG